MQIIRYVCDRCKKDISEKERVKIHAYAGEDFLSFSTDLDNADFCKRCFAKIQREIFQLDEPAEEASKEASAYPITITVPVAEAAPEPERIELPKEEPKHAPISVKKKKLQSLNEELKEEARRRYRAGQEMLDIAKEMNCYPYVISDLIQKEGLGEERYAGQKIPSNGGAPIPTCTVMGGTGKAKER